MSSSSRSLLESVIESGEEENGSIEFKESLSKDIHLNDEKRDSLVAQLRHRVVSGDGEATYVVGVGDDGEIKGLTQPNFEETVDVISLISSEASSHISSVDTWTVENSDDKLVGLVTVKDGEKMPMESNHLVVGTAGHVDHGKSTLVGSLVTGESDNGEGGMRSYLDVQPHEVQRGLSADLSYAVYGFNEENEPVHLDNPNRNKDRSNIVGKADRLVSFVDTVGHKPWLHTTIRGLVGQRLDYGLIAVAADSGPTQTTREHLGVLLAMGLPTIIAITKTDLVTDERIDEVELELEKVLRNTGCTALPESRYETDTLISDIDSEVVPIIRTSAVEQDGLDTLNEMFSRLQKTNTNENNGDFKMYIDKTYVVEGVGTVVSGSIMSGTLEAGDELKLGPTTDGEYIDTKCRSIEIHYHQVEKAEAGQLVSISISNVDADQVRRGMVITDSEIEPTTEFEAEVMILNHPTSIGDGYEPVIHLETVSETVQLEPTNPPLLAGDKGKTRVKFKFNPYVVEEGQRFIFREGDSKGVGTVTKTLSS
jgi:elongation factor 1-alpha